MNATQNAIPATVVKTPELLQSDEASAKVKPILINKLGDFGEGRYSKVMGELYEDTQRVLGFSKQQAHAVATGLGCDLGKLQTAEARLTFGNKLSKEGYRTIKEVAGIKVIETTAITCAFLCSRLHELSKQGLVMVENTVADKILESINAQASRLVEKTPEQLAAEKAAKASK